MNIPETMRFEGLAPVDLLKVRRLAEDFDALGWRYVVTVELRREGNSPMITKEAAVEKAATEVFPVAAPVVVATEPQKESDQEKAQRLLGELQSGRRRTLSGFRAPVVRLVMAPVLDRLYQKRPAGQLFTQEYWDSVRPQWAPPGMYLPKTFGMTWLALVNAVALGSLLST